MTLPCSAPAPLLTLHRRATADRTARDALHSPTRPPQPPDRHVARSGGPLFRVAVAFHVVGEPTSKLKAVRLLLLLLVGDQCGAPRGLFTCNFSTRMSSSAFFSSFFFLAFFVWLVILSNPILFLVLAVHVSGLMLGASKIDRAKFGFTRRFLCIKMPRLASPDITGIRT